MKKILFVLLAALSFVACNKNDDNTPEEQIVAVEDYSSTVNMSYANMIKTYGEPSTAFGNFYVYDIQKNNVESIICIVNKETNSVYQVVETLMDSVYTAEQLDKYFSSKYTSYGYVEEEGTYNYGNADKEEDASLVITVTGNTTIVYTNPAAVPVVKPAAINGTPTQVIAAVMSKNINDLMEQYGSENFVQMANYYMLTYENDPYLAAVALDVEADIVVSATILFNEELEEADLISYFEGEGYICMPTGNADEDTGAPEYLFMNMTTGVTIIYCDYIGKVTVMDDMGGDDEGED